METTPISDSGQNYQTIDPRQRRVKQKRIQTDPERTHEVSKCYFTKTHCSLIGASLGFGMFLTLGASCFLSNQGCITIGYPCDGECEHIQKIVAGILLGLTTITFIGTIASACISKSKPCCSN